MKFRTLLTLAIASLCSWQSAWADRSAPQLPTAVAPESETSYYLYNVMEQKFLCRSTTNTSYAGLGTYGDKITVTSTGTEGEYYIQWASNNYYWAGYDTYISSSSGSNSNNKKFTFSESSKGYTIQRSPSNTTYYKADEFIGYDGSNGDRLSPALAEGSIHWTFLTVDEAEYYIAKHKLYTYLEVADQYNFYITQYEQVYNNPESTTADLDLAQSTLANALDMSQNYVSPSWTEYPILFQNTTDNKWEFIYNKNGFMWKHYLNGATQTATLTGTVNVDTDATLVYSYYCEYGYSSLRIYLDGELVQTIKYNQSNSSTKARHYYVELTPGKHDIVWEAVDTNASTGTYGYNTLSNIGVINTPTITPATTTVEGQLGTEVLKLVDPVSSVKKIIINGIIGADDWTTIGLMVNAHSIDMSGATATAPMPASIFTGSKFPFLHSVKLPEGLTAIGEKAFYWSDVENDMTFPNSLKSIGQNAFRGAKLKGAYMPDGTSTVGGYAFQECYFLENVTYPSKAVVVPVNCFSSCNNLHTFTIPEGITTISQNAFENCSLFNPRFPSTMKEIEYRAFYNTATDKLYITEDMTVHWRAFGNCNSLVYAEWPTSFAGATGWGSYDGTIGAVSGCPKLADVYLKSPTVVTYDSQNFFNGNTLSNITLHVPDFLVSAYKLDPYWYQCNVVGFDASDISDWYVKKPLTLNVGQRIGGTPNLHISTSGQLTVNGDDTQTIGNMDINYNPVRYYISGYGYVDQQWGMMLSNTNKVNITGTLSEEVVTENKKWYFLTLPFDTKVGDITSTAIVDGSSSSFAIRYYDGAQRASTGTGSSWKNYTNEDIIPAGTGFIFQTSKDACSQFVAQDNATKQYILSNNEFVKALQTYDTDVTANKSWNLVGNPWQTYYNIHKLNFTAPITVWDFSNKKYVAYSIIDDDYAIKPLEAIFVQCPDEINSISFPIDGRQLTDVIESQSGARPYGTVQESTRKLIDIELTNGEQSDKTRFVLNPQAKMDYETTCDASKFMSMDASVPQIYTIENGVQMAINERPAGDGTVQIGIKVAANGTYTILTNRSALTDAVLVDKQNGTETRLTAEGYTFSAEAGTTDNRFELRLSAGETTGIKQVDSQELTVDGYYNLNGQRINQPKKGLYIVNGKKVVVK